jgi:putative sigma-54 modulation protein
MKEFDINEIQLKVQSPDMQIDGKTDEYINAQIEKLGKIFQRITQCEVMLKNEKDAKLKNCIVEVKLIVPGDIFYSSGRNEDLQQAIKLAFGDVRDQLTRFKEKLQDKTH